jgi:hypothetical protein
MKIQLFLSMIPGLVLGILPLRAENPPLGTAVFNFQTAGDKLANKGADVAVLLGAQLSTAPNIMLIERQELEKVLGEQELSLSGTVNSETAAKVGALTGAKVLITGRVFAAGSKNFIVAKIISTETSRVFGEMVSFESPDAIDKAVAELAPKIVAVFNTQSTALVALVEPPGAQIARLKEQIHGRKLPSVSVKVSEQHLSRPVIDPAVETELQSSLQQLGFEVIDPKSTNKTADVTISGEAFSELAGRRGSLVSCRARVELKASRPADGKLLYVDRQTDVAVDLAENVAAKSALENAARKLLDRLVPKLTQP